MAERRRLALGWWAISLFAAYACSGRSLDDDGGEAGTTSGGSLAGRGGSGGSASGRGGGNQGKGGSINVGGTGNGAVAGTGLDGGSSGSGGAIGPTGGTAGNAGAPEDGGAGAGEEPIGGAGAGEGGAGASGAAPFACKDPRSFDGGYVACASDVPRNFVFREFSDVYYGYLHRPTTGTCPNGVNYDDAQGSAGVAGAGGHGGGDSCSSNADCGAPNYCGPQPGANYCDDGYGDPVCHRGCESDADCSEGQICLCGNLLTLSNIVGACVPASCKTDADCEPGYRCASTFGEAYAISFSCQTPDDECAGRDDCVDRAGGEGGFTSSVGGTECTQGPQRRTCGDVQCAHDWGQAN